MKNVLRLRGVRIPLDNGEAVEVEGLEIEYEANAEELAVMAQNLKTLFELFKAVFLS